MKSYPFYLGLITVSVLLVIAISNCGKDDTSCPTCPPPPCDTCSTVLPIVIADTLNTTTSPINVSPLPTFTWPAIAGATSYRFQLATDSLYTLVMLSNTQTSLIIDTVLTNFTTYSPPLRVKCLNCTNPNSSNSGILECLTKYYWRICPIINGVQGAWSPSYHFTTALHTNLVIGTYPVTKYYYYLGWDATYGSCHGFNQTCYIYKGTSEVTLTVDNNRFFISEVGNSIKEEFSQCGNTELKFYHGAGGQPYGTVYADFSPDKDSFSIELYSYWSGLMNPTVYNGYLMKGVNPLKR
jgi:hypothetical protein